MKEYFWAWTGVDRPASDSLQFYVVGTTSFMFIIAYDHANVDEIIESTHMVDSHHQISPSSNRMNHHR